MPERMRLIRNRAEAIFQTQLGAGSVSDIPSKSPLARSIPPELRQHYHKLAEDELVAEHKISPSGS